jgi:hypothetical protein
MIKCTVTVIQTANHQHLRHQGQATDLQIPRLAEKKLDRGNRLRSMSEACADAIAVGGVRKKR